MPPTKRRAVKPAVSTVGKPDATPAEEPAGKAAATPPDDRPETAQQHSPTSPGSSAGRRFEILTNWITALAAVAALVLSVVTYMQVNQLPALDLVVPKVMRVSQGQGQIEVYVQPTFTLTNKSEAPAVITDVRVRLKPPAGAGGTAPNLVWWEISEFDPSDKDPLVPAVNRFKSDPTPITVTRDRPESLMLRFSSLRQGGGSLTTGVWRGEFVISQDDAPDVTADFCIDLSNMAALSDGLLHVYMNADSTGSAHSGCHTLLY